MAKKPSRTALNIRSINSYIQTIANTFGINSSEYQAATVPLKQFDIRDKTVNGQTIVQIKNTAANRKKHQTIRAIRNRRKPVQILKRRYERMRQAQTATLPSIERGESAKNFYRWYAESKHKFDGLWDEIYNYLSAATELVGEDLDVYQAFKDPDYKLSKWETVYEKGGKTYADISEFLDKFEPVNDEGIDESTGESVTFTNADYTDTDMEFD